MRQITMGPWNSKCQRQINSIKHKGHAKGLFIYYLSTSTKNETSSDRVSSVHETLVDCKQLSVKRPSRWILWKANRTNYENKRTQSRNSVFLASIKIIRKIYRWNNGSQIAKSTEVISSQMSMCQLLFLLEVLCSVGLDCPNTSALTRHIFERRR